MSGMSAAANSESDLRAQIELREVFKSYDRHTVLESVNLEIEQGEFLAVMGRSGSGKSTLLKLIGGLEKPDRGEVRHGRRELAALTETERAHFRRESLGFVFQFFNLIPTLTVAENVSLPLALNGLTRADTEAKTGAMLAELDLAECADRFPEQLSGGEQQRVAIARALIHAPRLVIADEPTGNLDRDTALQVLAVLEQGCRQRGTTLIVATHSREVAAHADRLLGIEQARLVGRQP
jgi:putative ABC transport system ATP-binding protein